MTSSILNTFDTWQTRLGKEKEVVKLLAERGAPAVVDLVFRKQSHNACVFQATLDGSYVFLKHYETDYGSTLTRKGVAETELVTAHMPPTAGGVAQVIWSSEPDGLVLMSQAVGTPVSDALSTGQADEVTADVATWLAGYVGPRTFTDTFSPSFWVKKRKGTEVSALSPEDQTRAAQLIDLQKQRHARTGNMTALKGHLPKDFAPHNLHWTGDAIWGFDIEGYSTDPISRAIARFAVLAERRLPAEGMRRFGVHPICLDAFKGAFDLSGDHPELLPFLIADELLDSLFRRHDDPVAGPVIRRALDAHLES